MDDRKHCPTPNFCADELDRDKLAPLVRRAELAETALRTGVLIMERLLGHAIDREDRELVAEAKAWMTSGKGPSCGCGCGAPMGECRAPVAVGVPLDRSGAPGTPACSACGATGYLGKHFLHDQGCPRKGENAQPISWKTEAEDWRAVAQHLCPDRFEPMTAREALAFVRGHEYRVGLGNERKLEVQIAAILQRWHLTDSILRPLAREVAELFLSELRSSGHANIGAGGGDEEGFIHPDVLASQPPELQAEYAKRARQAEYAKRAARLWGLRPTTAADLRTDYPGRDWKAIAEALLLANDVGESVAAIRERFGLQPTPRAETPLPPADDTQRAMRQVAAHERQFIHQGWIDDLKAEFAKVRADERERLAGRVESGDPPEGSRHWRAEKELAKARAALRQANEMVVRHTMPAGWESFQHEHFLPTASEVLATQPDEKGGEP